MPATIELTPIDMTPSVMQDVEERGLIIRLAPGRHELPAAPGETLWEPIYDSSEKLGPHRLIAVSVNKTTLDEFGTHRDNEEFLLVGERELVDKIARKALTADDFMCLRVKYNDPEVSFFTMLAGVPHGEAIGGAEGRPATFYVTEPRDLTTELSGFGHYELRVADA